MPIGIKQRSVLKKLYRFSFTVHLFQQNCKGVHAYLSIQPTKFQVCVCKLHAFAIQ